jgi:transposase
MKNKYRYTNTTVSLIHYHFIFCPRYRRKIFLIPKVEQRFKELIQLKCQELEIEIITIECDKDHVHIFLNCSPTYSPSNIVRNIKSYTSKILRKEFLKLNKMPNLWTKNYFVSTTNSICNNTIKKYVENQKKRY